MLNPRYVLLILTANAIIVSFVMIAVYGVIRCKFTPIGHESHQCTVVPYCAGPAYSSIEYSATGETDLLCAWSAGVPAISYVGLGLSTLALIVFALKSDETNSLFLNVKLILGLLTSSVLAITILLMWFDIYQGSTVYSDPTKGTTYSAVPFIITAMLFVFIFLAFMNGTIDSYKKCAKSIKKVKENSDDSLLANK